MSGGRWSAQYRDGGVRISYDEDTDTHEVQVTLSDLRRCVKDEIVASLGRALAGCDRLSSLAHLSMLNADLPEQSIARQRNVMTVTTLMFGLMREVAEVLTDLRKAGIEGALRDTSPWTRIDVVR